MDLEYSQHAIVAMHERQIEQRWVERVVAAPVLRLDDPNDKDLERFYAPVRRNDARILRVVVNTSTTPWRVVTVFFDRGMRVRL